MLTILAEGAMKVFGDDFHYVHRFENADAAALIFKATVASREVDGLDLLTFDADGLITELKVMVRPSERASMPSRRRWPSASRHSASSPPRA